MYTVRTLILWFINECVITFLAISQCRVVKKWGGGRPRPPCPPGSDAYVNPHACGEFHIRWNHYIWISCTCIHELMANALLFMNYVYFGLQLYSLQRLCSVKFVCSSLRFFSSCKIFNTHGIKMCLQPVLLSCVLQVVPVCR